MPADERDPKPILLDRAHSSPDEVRPPPLPADVVRPPPRPIRLETVARPTAPSPRRAPTPIPEPTPRPTEHDSFSSDGAVYTGDVLKRAREARGLSIEQVCARTRIPRQHVVNLEADRYDQLPSAVYLRGILMSLAKELRLDGQKVARSYLNAISAPDDEQDSR